MLLIPFVSRGNVANSCCVKRECHSFVMHREGMLLVPVVTRGNVVSSCCVEREC